MFIDVTAKVISSLVKYEKVISSLVKYEKVVSSLVKYFTLDDMKTI